MAALPFTVTDSRLRSTPAWTQPALGFVLALVVLKVLIHLATNWRYGFHFDEFYYIAGGHHLAFGYVDHPPMTPLLARLFTGLLGDSVSALRLAPALAGAGIVFLTAWMARELGGRPSAHVLAAAVVVVCPAFLGAHTMFQTVTFNQLAWTGACCVLLRIMTTGNTRLWMLFGVVAGIGLMTKLTIVVLLAATGLALLVTPCRRVLRTPWPWVGAVLAGLIFLPHVLWQVASDWPTLGFVREQAGTDWFFPGAATLTQLIAGGPALAPILVAGVLFYFSQAGTRYRLMGWTYLFVLLIFELLRGKCYYPLTMYPVLLAAGAVAIDRWMARRATVLRRRLLIGALGVNLAPPLCSRCSRTTRCCATTFRTLPTSMSWWAGPSWRRRSWRCGTTYPKPRGAIRGSHTHEDLRHGGSARSLRRVPRFAPSRERPQQLLLLGSRRLCLERGGRCRLPRPAAAGRHVRFGRARRDWTGPVPAAPTGSDGSPLHLHMLRPPACPNRAVAAASTQLLTAH